jgi:2-iminobutanoate/2-iminopropanoate deaminase
MSETPNHRWKRVTAPDVPEVPAFAHAAVAGDTVYVAGMLGLADDGSALVPGGVGPETTQALRLAERILAATGGSLADVVKVSAYMTDLGEWEAMNEAYMEAFGAHTPARITVGVDALLLDARVEFDCIAVRR